MASPEPEPQANAALIHTWKRQRAWSDGARKAQRAVKQAQAANLVLMVGAALLGAFASQADWFSDGWLRMLSALAAVLLAIAGLLQARFLTAARTKAWTVARSASETLKAGVFEYLSGVSPYENDDRDQLLLTSLGEVEAAAGKLGVRPGDPDNKAVPPVGDITTYRTERTQEQRDWHDRRRHDHDRSARRSRLAQFLFTGLGAILGFAGSVESGGPEVDAWVTAAAAVGAAIAAHSAANRYDHISQTYEATVAQLDRAMVSFEISDKHDREAERSLVVWTEEILARQNDSWLNLVDRTSSDA